MSWAEDDGYGAYGAARFEELYRQIKYGDKMSENNREVIGSVWEVKEKDWSGKKLYTLVVADASGNTTNYGVGEKKGSAEVGDKVKFIAYKTGKGFWQLSKDENVKVAKGKGTQPPADYSQKKSFPSKGGWKSGGYKSDPNQQKLITYQHAQKVAVELVTAALTTDTLPLPGKGGKAAKEAALRDYLREYTHEIFLDVMDLQEKLTAGVPVKALFQTKAIPDVGENTEENIPDEEISSADDFEETVSDDGFEEDDEFE